MVIAAVSVSPLRRANSRAKRCASGFLMFKLIIHDLSAAILPFYLFFLPFYHKPMVPGSPGKKTSSTAPNLLFVP